MTVKSKLPLPVFLTGYVNNHEMESHRIILFALKTRMYHNKNIKDKYKSFGKEENFLTVFFITACWAMNDLFQRFGLIVNKLFWQHQVQK